MFRSHRFFVLAARLALGLAVLVAPTACGNGDRSTAVSTATPIPTAVSNAVFEQLEKSFKARLGVYAVDTGNGAVVAYRADERFAYASTHKVFSAAAVLQRTPTAGLDRMVRVEPADVVNASPISSKHAGGSMTLRELIDAALRYSDNTADNLLFRQIGGPAGLARFLRSIGDTTSHVDRIEPDLNVTAPGDLRDTSTPRAFAADVRAVTLGDVLPPDRRTVLTDTMRANTTGDAVIRAGVPSSWQVADKTGTADYGTRNDIAVIWPPQRAPIVMVILSDLPGQHDTPDDKLIAKAAAIVARDFQ
jgi:beta-lactamase class A